MTGQQLADKCMQICTKYKTVYAKGTFGQKATNGIIDGKTKQYPSWYTKARVNMLKGLPDDTRMFDCCGLIKGIMWGFPDMIYTSNGVKDQNDQMMWNSCKDQSKDFSNIQIGELLWMKGHVGVYIGNGKGIECTPAWENKVQITAVANMGKITGIKSRKWTAHGKLPFITYNSTSVPSEKPKPDYSKYPVLKRGSKGDYVVVLQKLLVKKGYDPKGIDGIFGPGCEAAVKKFQKEHVDINGKKLAVDGCVGPLTWGALYAN